MERHANRYRDVRDKSYIRSFKQNTRVVASSRSGRNSPSSILRARPSANSRRSASNAYRPAKRSLPRNRERSRSTLPLDLAVAPIIARTLASVFLTR